MVLRQILAALAFFSLGTVFVVWPVEFQKWALKSQAATRGPAKRNAHIGWVESPRYPTMIRTFGVIALGASALIVIASLRS